jgi:two-component system, sensor histidine kinase and response regulator
MTVKYFSNHFNLRALRLAVLAAAVLTTIVGILVLLGWLFDVGTLKSVLPGKSTMKPNTALCFVLSGVALWFTVSKDRLPDVDIARRHITLLCASLVTIISVVTLIQYLFALDLKIDSLIFRHALLAENNDALGGRMSGVTALAFVFLGIALMLQDAKSRIVRLSSEILSLATLIVGTVTLIGYGYGVESLYRFQNYRAMAVHTALLFIVLGWSVLFARPQQGLIAVFTSDHGGGLMSRRVLPLAALLPFLLGYVRLEGQRAGLFGTEFGLALFATSNIAIFTVLIWLSARSLNHTDTNRRRDDEKMRASEQSFRQLADAMPQMVWTANPDGERNYYNQRWFDYTGLTLEQTQASGWKPVVHPEDLDQCVTIWSHALRTGEQYECKHRFRRASDGVYRWHLGRATAVRGDGGAITKWYGTCTDIDDQQKAEVALLRSRGELEANVNLRTVELTLEIVERKRIEAEQQILFEITQGVATTGKLDELLLAVHRSLGKVLKADNFFVALHDKATGLFKMEFFIDKYDEAPPPLKLEKSRTAYVFRTGLPILLTSDVFDQLVAEGEVESVGTPPATWLGVPLWTPSEVIGVLVMQHYEDKDAYSTSDLGFLTSVGGQIALAIERRRAEEALRESEAQFKDLFDAAPVAYHELDREGHIVKVNLTELRLLGYTTAEMLGRYAWEFIVQKVSQEATAAKLAGKMPLLPFERTYIRKDGALVSMMVQDQLIHDKAGHVTGIRSTLHDITERNRMEAGLRESEERYRDLFDNAQDAIYVHDLNGVYLSANRAAENLVGYTRDEILGKNIIDFMAPEHAEQIRTNLQLKINGKGLTSYEIEVIGKDGRRVPVEVSTRLIYEDGRPVSVQGIARDITERKRIEQDRLQLADDLKNARDAALESVRLKSEFLANMSHEIRTPMNGVVGMTGLLLDTDLSADQRDFAETIRSSGDALLTIINDILDFSKIEAGKLDFETLDFDLRNAVEETVDLLAEQARGKQLEFASLIYRDVPTRLRGDPGRLRQVLTNLVGNALKFTEHGEVIVRAEKENETETTVTIRFTVSDTGIGISEAAQTTLFQAFTQADGSTTRKYGGTGLGLSISKQLVEMMGGQIGVTSTPGQGSAFWFTSKLEKQQEPVVNIALLPVENIANLRVLIVDDNATNRKILSHQLGSWGMIHHETDSATAALKLLQTAEDHGAGYDLAILDLLMPDMDGFELARAIKSDPRLSAVQLVMLTSAGIRGDAATIREAGVAAYLTKPVRQSQLFDCLTTVVSNSSNLKELSPGPTDPIPKHPLPDGNQMSHKLILLAEDNIVNQKVAVRQLHKLGFRADAVANGREAIEALGRIPYDLVLMDCQMPEMDGYEATTEIRRLEGVTKRTPIVAMTAHALPRDREKSIAAGMDDHITKPVRQNDLARILELFLSDHDVAATTAIDRDAEITPPVDLDRLLQVVGDNPVEISEILDLYRDEMTKNLLRLDSAIASGNAREVNVIAHTCAGSSANCGMVAVVDQLRELERMGRENELTGAPQLTAQIGVSFERIKNFLETTYQPLPAH